MPAKPYFPRTEGAQISWFGNLKLKIGTPAYLAALSINAGDVSFVQSICTLFIYMLETYLPAVRSYGEAWTALVAQLRKGTPGSAITFPTPPAWNPPAGSASPTAGILKQLFDMIARWKTATGYDDSIGEDLGIIGVGTEPSTAAPELTVSTSPDGVTLDFIKHGHMGIYLESRRQGEETWAFLAIDTDSPYLDNRSNRTPGQSEWREYRARYWDGTPVGDWSGAVRANVG